MLFRGDSPWLVAVATTAIFAIVFCCLGFSGEPTGPAGPGGEAAPTVPASAPPLP